MAEFDRCARTGKKLQDGEPTVEVVVGVAHVAADGVDLVDGKSWFRMSLVEAERIFGVRYEEDGESGRSAKEGDRA